MPIVDLNTPTQLLLHWGWLLVTRANGIVYVLLVVVFLIGALVTLPGGRTELPARTTPADDDDRETGGAA